MTQPVLRQGDSAMRYCVGIFAAECARGEGLEIVMIAWAAASPPCASQTRASPLPLFLPAARDIKRGTELTYNYGYRPGTVAGKELQCHCGAPCCQGRLI